MRLKIKKKLKKRFGKLFIEREKLIENLSKFSIVEKIYPTDANFVLVKTIDAEKIYKFLLDEKIVVRNRNNVELCEGCLRITIGTPDENESLLTALKKITDRISGNQQRIINKLKILCFFVLVRG